MSTIDFLDNHELALVPDEHHHWTWTQVPPNLIDLMDAMVEKKIVCCPGYNLHPGGYDARINKMEEHDAEGSIQWDWKIHAYGDYVHIHYDGRNSDGVSTQEIGKMMQLFCHAEDIDYEWDGTGGDAFSIDPGFSDE